ncbi:MAG: hypothetical protein ACD_31C00002G0030 [uncultured bacterium]|uniref:Uncharacterized protein n=2 Tax=Candidatus Daviesiibacteriota TaxID=1752718 RepID=A0A1F5K7E6_9BACT|nr:MAG: hypothetical protein ACD_31C00002G0030 [uncultured bacterium]OGE17486.1 MAG: hypothetical protein A2858_01090 [Candidatus Daviesbacteria bacterium RIFCSPHIGHO2_01_FULL_36_37]OGE36581.1 MAG: hypothetical protein A3E66_02935 [Candidatus Daviesbacteria bacterium RIFCSPHIGHO2_12_FULL_37_16]
MLDKAKVFLSNRTNLILVGVLVLLLAGGIFAFQRFFAGDPNAIVEEIDLAFDPEGPYALLYPRRDGNALNLSLKRTGTYDKISYELAYVANADATGSKDSERLVEDGISGIDRGVMGEVDTSKKKSEYEQEILFGTCSKNVCKYDQGVENGTLTLHIRKGKEAYRMVTQWKLQKPDVALGKLSSGDEHFKYETTASREELTLVGYTIINELTGVPKLPSGKEILGTVYALNVPLAKSFPKGAVSFELAENPPGDAKIARFLDSKNDWEILETKINGSKLSADSGGEGIFAILADSK